MSINYKIRDLDSRPKDIVQWIQTGLKLNDVVIVEHPTSSLDGAKRFELYCLIFEWSYGDKKIVDQNDSINLLNRNEFLFQQKRFRIFSKYRSRKYREKLNEIWRDQSRSLDHPYFNDNSITSLYDHIGVAVYRFSTCYHNSLDEFISHLNTPEHCETDRTLLDDLIRKLRELEDLILTRYPQSILHRSLILEDTGSSKAYAVPIQDIKSS